MKFILCLCLSFSLLLQGCASPKPSLKDRHITLEFWTLQLDAFADVLKPMFAEYERQHPGIRIHWVDIPFTEGSKRTLTAMMSDRIPDVINSNPDFSAILASRHALIDMNQAIDAKTRQHYLPVAWETATLNRSGAKPVTFGVPWYLSSAVTLYNTQLLHQAGFQKPPASWEALPAFIQALHQHSSAYGMMPTLSENGHFLKELQSLGVTLYNARGRAIFANQPEAALHLQQCVDLYRSGAFPAEALTESHQSAVARYQAGTLAMINIGPNFLKILKENSPARYAMTAIAPQFPLKASNPDFSLMLLTVPLKSHHPKEAVRFATFITNAENQMRLVKAAPVLPSITSALQTIFTTSTPTRLGETTSSQISFAQEDVLMAQGRAMSAAQLLRAHHSDGLRPDQNTINQTIDYYVQLALLGKKSPQQALSQAQADINASVQ
jgi:putative chitobiose transport system substrate-binding protein